MVIRLGIIGLSADQSAWANMAHVQAIKPGGPLTDLYKLAALATSNPESAKAAAEFHGVPADKAYSKPEDIANDPEVDLVVVSVKVPMHKQLTLPALRAKKDVLVEWPLGANLAEAEEMASLAKKQGVNTYVCLQARLQPAFVKVKEIVASGALGRVISTTVLGTDSQMMDVPEKARYANDPSSGASILSIPVTHTLDAVLHALASELSSLSATLTITHPTITFISPSTGAKSAPEPRRSADNIAITGTLTPSGAPLSFHYLITTPATPSTFQWTICGEKASLRMEGKSFAVQMMPPKLLMAEAPQGGQQKGIYDSREGGAEWREIEVPGSGLGVFGGVAEVYEKIGKGETDGLVGFEEAVVRHKMVEAIERSAREGSRVEYL
ncbi:MAG: hypothetical protein LQ344_004176 [Seirophora lacunosa]|nr:MAG: hypothetical protein LQ344_004176 [Seirophora lacunosa]